MIADPVLDGFASIDNNTGMININGSESIVGSYAITVRAKNDFGEKSANISLDIYIPIAEFSYDLSHIVLSDFQNYKSEKPNTSGAIPSEFILLNASEVGRFVNLDSSTGQFEIDSENTTIGQYTFQIEARGEHASIVTDVNLDILEYPNVIGSWTLDSATLLNGIYSGTEEGPLVVDNYFENNEFILLSLPIGESHYTKILVQQVLGEAVCNNSGNFSTMYQEFKSDKQHLLYCPDEENKIFWEDYKLSKLNRFYNLGTYELGLTGHQIIYSHIEVSPDGSRWTGRGWFPMYEDLTKPYNILNSQQAQIDFVWVKLEE